MPSEWTAPGASLCQSTVVARLSGRYHPRMDAIAAHHEAEHHAILRASLDAARAALRHAARGA